MDAVTLLSALTARGLTFIADPPKLRARPNDLLTDADREALRAHKEELLRLLATDPEPPSLPIDLGRVADAIARQPRSLFLNDLAIATIVRGALSAQAAMSGLPPAVHTAAITRCRDLQDRIVAAIENRDYQGAYEIAAQLDRLPREITELRPQ